MSSSSLRRGAAGVLVLFVSLVPAIVLASAAGAQSGADAVEACQPATDVPELGPRTCKSVQSGTWLAAQYCRHVPGAESDLCPAIDGRQIDEASMEEFEASWVARALDLQRDLDRDVPLLRALIPSTHNSANSAAYDPSLSNTDANQVVTLTDQLRLGIRGIEIDVHWTPNPAGSPDDGFRAVVQCHGEPVGTPAGSVHAGCSVDTPLPVLLAELHDWLVAPGNEDELVLLYLENALDDDPTAHAQAVAAIDAELGDLVFRPTEGAGCQQLPVASQSKGSILATGARVIITGNCGPDGNVWNDRVFERGAAWTESGSTTDYTCADDRGQVDYETRFVRRYEDSTWLSKMAGGGSHITPEVLADMVRCGVNLPGLDQVHARDDRLPSLVWSWRQDEPATGATDRCAAQGTDGRFFADDCTGTHRVACRTAVGWTVTEREVAWAETTEACAAIDGAVAGVPANGAENDALRRVADEAGADDVWLAYAQDDAGAWLVGAPDAGGDTADQPGRSGDAPGIDRRPDVPAGPSAAHRTTPAPVASPATEPAGTSSVPAAPALLVGLLVVSLALVARPHRVRARR